MVSRYNTTSSGDQQIDTMSQTRIKDTNYYYTEPPFIAFYRTYADYFPGSISEYLKYCIEPFFSSLRYRIPFNVDIVDCSEFLGLSDSSGIDYIFEGNLCYEDGQENLCPAEPNPINVGACQLFSGLAGGPIYNGLFNKLKPIIYNGKYLMGVGRIYVPRAGQQTSFLKPKVISSIVGLKNCYSIDTGNPIYSPHEGRDYTFILDSFANPDEAPTVAGGPKMFKVNKLYLQQGTVGRYVPPTPEEVRNYINLLVDQYGEHFFRNEQYLQALENGTLPIPPFGHYEDFENVFIDNVCSECREEQEEEVCAITYEAFTCTTGPSPIIITRGSWVPTYGENTEFVPGDFNDDLGKIIIVDNKCYTIGGLRGDLDDAILVEPEQFYNTCTDCIDALFVYVLTPACSGICDDYSDTEIYIAADLSAYIGQYAKIGTRCYTISGPIINNNYTTSNISIIDGFFDNCADCCANPSTDCTNCAATCDDVAIVLMDYSYTVGCPGGMGIGCPNIPQVGSGTLSLIHNPPLCEWVGNQVPMPIGAKLWCLGGVWTLSIYVNLFCGSSGTPSIVCESGLVSGGPFTYTIFDPISIPPLLECGTITVSLRT